MMIGNMNLIETAILIAGYVFLLVTSGIMVNCIMSRVSGVPISQKIGKEARDTGFIIGKCENLLIHDFRDSGSLYRSICDIRCENHSS